MASSSTAKGSSFDSSGIQWEYEVFLSFRGEDTRYTFTDHLYTALNDRGIYTFRDDEGLQRGKEISSELLETIKRSRFSIIVLSKNYASSAWCLEELAKILECMDPEEQKVFPVFYKVNPSDLRKQSGDFGTAFHKHEEDYKDNLDKVRRWRSALTQVGNLSGWSLQENRSEAEFIKLVVDTISSEYSNSDKEPGSEEEDTYEGPYPEEEDIYEDPYLEEEDIYEDPYLEEEDTYEDSWWEEEDTYEDSWWEEEDTIGDSWWGH